MTRVKGQGILIGRVAGKAGKPMQEPIEEWSDETPDSQQLRRALIEAGRAAMPRPDPDRLDRVFRRIIAELERGERNGIPVARIETPSSVTAKNFG